MKKTTTLLIAVVLMLGCATNNRRIRTEPAHSRVMTVKTDTSMTLEEKVFNHIIQQLLKNR